MPPKKLTYFIPRQCGKVRSHLKYVLPYSNQLSKVYYKWQFNPFESSNWGTRIMLHTSYFHDCPFFYFQVTKNGKAEILTSEQVTQKHTDKFREKLLHGHKKEGLEYAMTHGLWGHALFLASKMDERSYSRVMLRFANGLDVNDPLQTLYQLMSGRLPIAVKVNMIF